MAETDTPPIDGGDRIGYICGMECVHPLKTYREKAGLTQLAAAQIAKVSRETWARWEIGIRFPSLTRAAKLSKQTGIPIEKFVKHREAVR